ncbi:hypothetical protein NBH19_17325, partial [Rhizobium sp. S95]|uniref:hypothetical protein n=1 Tax=Ciceribacter sp. S95 TaxID=2949648 RepID=UPI0020346816
SPVARQAHNLKAAGSNPAPATTETCNDIHSCSRSASTASQRRRNFVLSASDLNSPAERLRTNSEDCPSSNDLRLLGLWKNGVSGSVCGLI